MEIFAHRGASGYAPQNTMSAMRLAVEQGCDGIELDAQLTSDNEVVICHDWTIDKVSDGKGKVGDFTLNEIKQFDFGSYFSREFQGEKNTNLVRNFRVFTKGDNIKYRAQDKSHKQGTSC